MFSLAITLVAYMKKEMIEEKIPIKVISIQNSKKE